MIHLLGPGVGLAILVAAALAAKPCSFSAFFVGSGLAVVTSAVLSGALSSSGGARHVSAVAAALASGAFVVVAAAAGCLTLLVSSGCLE